MNSMHKLLTSALVISGATALAVLETEAVESGLTDKTDLYLPLSNLRDTKQINNLRDDQKVEDYETQLTDNETQLTDLEVIEDALKQFVNPLHRIHNHLEYFQPDDHITYEVQEGDTISGISVQFGIPIAEIVSQNNIKNKHRISKGQKLQIRLKEQDYFVQHGQDIAQIAELKGIKVDDLLAYNEELLATDQRTYPGQHLKIPTAPPEPAYQPLAHPRKSKVNIASRHESASLREISGFEWPVEGILTSSYGPRWGRMHQGIDIAHSAKAKASIVAAQAGLVSEAYYHRGGYGNLVILDHGGGIETYYAHLSSIEVQVGDELKQGELLGYMGSTGQSTGYHLHFEIRKDKQPLNPLKYLPASVISR